MICGTNAISKREIVGVTITPSSTIYFTGASPIGVLTAIYNDGSSEIVTPDSISPSIITASTTSVIFSYGGYTASQSVAALYTEVTWLRSTNAQHIDTGYVPNNNTRVRARMSWQQFNNSYWGGFGAATSATSRAFECYVYSNYVNWNFLSTSYGADSGRGYAGSTNTLYHVDANKNVFSIAFQGSNLKTITATNGTFTAPYTMYLFASHRASSGHGYVTFYGHVYIYDNDVLVREFVPCYRVSDDVAGMFDIVNNVFYTNGGSGSFTRSRDAANMINYDAWKATATIRGTSVWENNGVTITATGDDAYTKYKNLPTDCQIPVTRGEKITLTWEESTNTSGRVFIFPNGGYTDMVEVNNSSTKSASYTVASGITYITFRFGVDKNGKTISYRNIKITSNAAGPIE